MDNLAKPQDLLLAYDPGFTGYTSLGSMSQPLEPEASGLDDSSTLGGSATPDGYYEDFTASLGRFVRDHPLLAGPRGGPKTGGARAASGPLNWGTMVISFGAPDDDDDDDDYGGERADDNEDDEEEDDDNDAVGGTHPTPLMSLGDFIVDADVIGGVSVAALPRADNILAEYDDSDEYVGGEMDETDAEAGSYERFRAESCVDDGGPASAPESILGFVADK